jgi:predicted DNA-binding transcriptional regulator YafY
MPAESPRNAVARQWEVLKLLPSTGRGRTAEEIAQGLKTLGYRAGLRTVQRDLAGLQTLFPINSTDEKPFRWKWTGISELAFVGLSVPDALALTLLERFIKPLLPTSVTSQLNTVFKVAATKLQQQKRNDLGRWSELVAVADRGIQVIPPTINTKVLTEVQDALLAAEKLKLSYTKADGTKRTGRVISPLGLVQNGSITYLVAHSQEHEPPSVVQLALHRVIGATRLYEKATKPQGFRLQKFIDEGGMEFGPGGHIALRARISALLVRQLTDTKLSADQKIVVRTGGRGTLTATVKNTWRLRWWILEKSGDIEVLSPQDLRLEIARTVQGAATTYRPD